MTSLRENSMESLELARFRSWLEEKELAKGKVLTDIVSRTKRVSSMVDLNKREDTDIFILSLSKHSHFVQLSVSVKSQLRKAVRLYREFKGL